MEIPDGDGRKVPSRSLKRHEGSRKRRGPWNRLGVLDSIIIVGGSNRSQLTSSTADPWQKRTKLARDSSV